MARTRPRGAGSLGAYAATGSRLRRAGFAGSSTEPGGGEELKIPDDRLVVTLPAGVGVPSIGQESGAGRGPSGARTVR